MSRSSLALVIAILAVPAVSAAGAQAGTLRLDKRCYHVGDPMRSVGAGFKPGEQMMLTGAFTDAPVTVERNGGFQVYMNPLVPHNTNGARPSDVLHARLRVSNPHNKKHRASVPYMVANYAFDSRSSANPRARRTWYFSGFRPNATIYGHFVKGSKVVTHRFAKARGACGLAHARAAGVPVPRRALKSGRWTIQIDTSRAFAAHRQGSLEKTVAVR
jgi:hypothetical protein